MERVACDGEQHVCWADHAAGGGADRVGLVNVDEADRGDRVSAGGADIPAGLAAKQQQERNTR